MSIHNSLPRACPRQRGMLILTTGFILMTLATIVALYATRVAVLEQAIAGNELQTARAFEVAQTGIGFGKAYLERNWPAVVGTIGDWQVCDANRKPDWFRPPLHSGCDGTAGRRQLWLSLPGEAGPPLSRDIGLRVHFLTSAAAGERAVGDPPIVTVVAEAIVDAADAGRQPGAFATYATVQAAVAAQPVLSTLPPAPVVAAGTLSGGGNGDIVVNPNGAGVGVPLGLWTPPPGSALTAQSPRQCHPHEYLRSRNKDASAFSATYKCVDCRCPPESALPGNALSLAAGPGDAVRLLFGLPAAAWRLIKQQARVVADCSRIDAKATGFYWVEGDCQLRAQQASARISIGSIKQPLLIVATGRISVAGPVSVFGLLFTFGGSGNAHSVAHIALRRGARLYGAAMADRALNLGHEHYRVIYARPVLENLQQRLHRLGFVPGSWSDYANEDRRR